MMDNKKYWFKICGTMHQISEELYNDIIHSIQFANNMGDLEHGSYYVQLSADTHLGCIYAEPHNDSSTIIGDSYYVQQLGVRMNEV